MVSLGPLLFKIMGDKIKCTQCPECDSPETVSDNLLGYGFRQCADCGQEWWQDIDYSGIVKKRHETKAKR